MFMRGKEVTLLPPLCLQGSCVRSARAARTSAPSTLLPSTPLTSPLRLDQHASPSRWAFASRGSRGGTVARSCLSSARLARCWTACSCTTWVPASPRCVTKRHRVQGRYGRTPFFGSVGGGRPASAGGRAPGGAGAGSTRRVMVCTCSGRAWTAVSSGTSR
jgi:hypothetical protein